MPLSHQRELPLYEHRVEIGPKREKNCLLTEGTQKKESSPVMQITLAS